MNVFDAFKFAVEEWTLCAVKRATEVGTEIVEVSQIDVIVDDVASGNLNTTPNAETLNTDVLLYTKPEQLPNIKPAALIGGFIVRDGLGYEYEIISAGIAKNQHVGHVEHVELIVREIGVA